MCSKVFLSVSGVSGAAGWASSVVCRCLCLLLWRCQRLGAQALTPSPQAPQGPPTGWCRDGPSYGTDGSGCIFLERSGHPCEVLTSLCTPGPQPQQWMGRCRCINTVQLVRSGGCWEGEREPSLRDEKSTTAILERPHRKSYMDRKRSPSEMAFQSSKADAWVAQWFNVCLQLRV